VKIRSVAANNRKKAFEIRTYKQVYGFPYALTDPRPGPDDAVERVYVDDELGREGFTYVLASGREGSVHVDSVLEYNRDPSHMADLALYKLTLEARKRMDTSRLSKREVIRRLGTSASQLYRLLDPTNRRKSLRQLMSLLAVLGYEVDIGVAPSRSALRVCEPGVSDPRPGPRRGRKAK
jgi:hypothetical protein